MHFEKNKIYGAKYSIGLRNHVIDLFYNPWPLQCAYYSDGDVNVDPDSEADDSDYELTRKRELAYLKLKLGCSSSIG